MTDLFGLHRFPHDIWLMIAVWYIIGIVFSFGTMFFECWSDRDKTVTLADVIESMLLACIGPILPLFMTLSIAAAFFIGIYKHLQTVIIIPKRPKKDDIK